MSLPAGWYSDPADGNVERYWDGSAWGTGPDAVRGEPSTPPRQAIATDDPSAGSFPVLAADPTPKPSAQLLLAGMLCLVLGPVVAAMFGGGLAVAVPAASQGALVAIMAGNLAMVVGIVLVIVGVYRLARGVDHLVARASTER